MARWILDLPFRLDPLKLSPTALAYVHSYIDKVLRQYRDEEIRYSFEDWACDVRVTLAMAIPASRSHVLDMRGELSPVRFIHHGNEGRGYGGLLQWLVTAGWRHWLDMRLDERDVSDLDVAGWKKAWITAAALLDSRPHLAGLTLSSWLNDPALEAYAPDLAYLRKLPDANGGVFIHEGLALFINQDSAMIGTALKQRLANGGLLLRSWIMVWPRSRLINWALNQIRN